MGLWVVLLGVGTGACAPVKFGESYAWKRPCGTEEQRADDRDACGAEAAGLTDPTGRSGEYAQDLFRRCMERRGWQRVPSDTVLACEQENRP